MPIRTAPHPAHQVPLSVALKAHTRHVHDRLDQHLLGQAIFASTERYLRFLRVQWHFHDAVAPILRAGADDGRLALLEQDFRDLGARRPDAHAWRPQLQQASPATVLGWRYVAEGSTMGAAVLLKAAAGLGLHAGHGARHLCPSPLGVAEYWRRTREQLDAATLGPADTKRACIAAAEAFQFVRRCVDEEFSSGLNVFTFTQW